MSYFALAALIAATLLPPTHAGAQVDPGSQLIGCDQADERIEITVSSHLDPSCTWTRGVEILASERDARLPGRAHRGARPPLRRRHPSRRPTSRSRTSPCATATSRASSTTSTSSARASATSPRASSTSTRFSNIVIEDSTCLNSRGVGIFVDGYVTGVTLRNLHVEGAGQHRHLPRGRLEGQRRREQRRSSTTASTRTAPTGSSSRSRASTSGSGAPAARASRSTGRASTSSATTASRATPPAASSSTRTAASS